MRYVMKRPYPAKGVRVIAVRESGDRIVARRDYKPDAFFRHSGVPHWLNDDDKFVDVAFDRVIDWEPLLTAEG